MHVVRKGSFVWNLTEQIIISMEMELREFEASYSCMWYWLPKNKKRVHIEYGIHSTKRKKMKSNLGTIDFGNID